MNNIKTIIILLITIYFSNKIHSQNTMTDSKIYLKAVSLKNKNPDSAAFYFNIGYETRLKEKDTLNAINYLIELSDLYAHNVNYGKSYDGYWEALLLAEKSNDLISISRIYQSLGWLYSFYKRDDEALKYFNLSINIQKKLLKEDNTEQNRELLQSNYFSILNVHRINGDFKKAKAYLDSCRKARKFNGKELTKSYYLTAEQGFLEATDKNFKKALKLLNESKDYFEKIDKSYLVIIYDLFGDVYRRMGDNKKSIESYKESLNISNTYNRHLNYRLFDYDALASLYFEEGNIAEAYHYLKLSKEGNEEIFGGKSENNKHLLEIKDQYRLEKDRQQKLLNQQRITKLEHEDKIQMLQSIILVGCIIFIVLYGYIFIRYLRNKYKNEKRMLEEKQQLKIQKQNEILELKNKELTEAALRLIEKDEFISNLKKKLCNYTGELNTSIIKRMLKSIQGGPNSNWKEFEARFTAINQSFYDKLNMQFPNLSQTDQKICALVKLNFPSKDMAKLLGISVESVHTSRYRLRKKLGLERNDNLEEFINKF
ncbi:tetratricopeptide repeat protein [Lutibacter sp. A80]|uniref:tetratricopeptide repeat protein n=1 Tax=Lutibacter sp. A80 TaxID=2918453 RepID=UPI001F061226|nr:tetratricopeptide repeat protein [Lutibacter sp. A80]UMB61760.1 tetratricopeptide repeat protein [Lutibacter sp. A80]